MAYDSGQALNIVTYNKNALNNLRRAVVLGQGQFSLVLANANYRRLCELMLRELSDPLHIHAVHLPKNATNLRVALENAAISQFPVNQPQALMVTGLEGVQKLETLLKSANLGRDELPKHFHYPVVLWVNDRVLQQLTRFAPDLKSFAATPIRFKYPTLALVTALTAQASDTYRQILDTDKGIVLSSCLPLSRRITEPLAAQELTFAIAQLEPQSDQLNNHLLADLLFLQGRNLHQQGDLLRARSYYEQSLLYWEKQPPPAEQSLHHNIQNYSTESAHELTPLDKQAVLQFHMGLWWRGQAVLGQFKPLEGPQPITESNEPSSYESACQQAKGHFEKCLAIFRQQNRPDRVGRFILALAEVLQKLELWPALAAIAQEGTHLHHHDPARLARDYGYLSEVALARYKTDPHPDYLSEAQGFAQQALEISEEIIAKTDGNSSSDDSTADSDEVNNSLDSDTEDRIGAAQTEDQLASQVALRYHRGCYLYLMAIARQLQDQPNEAIEQLELARQQADPRYDLSLYRRILQRLRSLYYDQKRYAEAFEVKLTQRRVENRFGLRAFIGAGQVQSPMVVEPGLPLLSPHMAKAIAQHLATEIKASGRSRDIDALIDRLFQPRYPLVVIHGQSGVGKSSILSAGLLPKLRSLTNEGRRTLPILISSYKQWAQQIGTALAVNQEPSSKLPQQPTVQQSVDPTVVSNHELEEIDICDPDDVIERLRTATHQYQQIILVFDQFEDFFYEFPHLGKRRSLYRFLRDCLDLPYVKVVLALREDFLHYLLEWERHASLSIINHDVLSKEVRYYLGNFTPKATEALIQELTQAAGFYLEDALVTALVDDLAAERGEVRPIELQVVGAQLQRENITTLKQYRQLGKSPKKRLLQNFLDSVIQDCGPENAAVAQAVLYLLSEGLLKEGNTRPLKSRAELEEPLMLSSLEAHAAQLDLVLDILIGSGLVFEIPEVSGPRYQLAHEYLGGLIQSQQQPGLLEALQLERQRRQLTENQLQQAIAAQSDSRAQTVLAKQKAQVAEIKALISVSRSLRLSGDGLEALAKALRAAQHVQQLQDSKKEQIAEQFPSNLGSAHLLKLQAALCLLASIRTIRERNELSGHQNWVVALDCNPAASKPGFSGVAIASASDDDTIKLWSTQGDLLRTLTGHTAGILDLKFSPDGTQIATASLDHTTRLWSAQGDFIRTVGHSEASVTSLSFCPTEPLLAATYSDTAVRLWPLGQTSEQTSEQTSDEFDAEPAAALTLEGHEDWVRSVAFSPDGKLLATGSEDHTVRIWDIRTGKAGGNPLHVLQGHGGWIRSVAFSPDGRTIAAAGDANTLRLWHRDGYRLKTFYGHTDWIRSIAFSPSGRYIASASDDQTVKIWTLDGQVQQTFNHRSSALCVAWSADGRTVVSGGDDDQVHIWQLMGITDTVYRGHDGIVWSAAWHPQGRSLLSAGGDNTVRLWDDAGQQLVAFRGHQRGVHSVAWHPNGKVFASASADYTVQLWRDNGTHIGTLKGHGDAVWQVCYSPDGTRLATVSSDRTVRLWHAKGKLLKTFTDHTDTVWSVNFSSDGQYLISASEDNTLRLWHVKKGLLQTVAGHTGGVWCAAFSPDSRQVASGGADGTIRLWQVIRQSGQSPQLSLRSTTLQGHRDWVRSVAFSPKGNVLASASDDGSVRLWSLSAEMLESSRLRTKETSQLLPPLLGHTGVVWNVAFDPTGDRLISASADGTLRLWDLRLETLMQQGCTWLSDWLKARPETRSLLCATPADQP